VEICDGINNDCDDDIDEGATICPQNLRFAVSTCQEQADGGASCQFSECTYGQVRCPGDEGCETAVSGAHCGACDEECGDNQRCAPALDSGVFECTSDGCPAHVPDLCGVTCVNKNSSPVHCGDCHDPDAGEVHACESVDNATPTCEDGDCALNCVPGFRSCDGASPEPGTAEYMNGCETHTDIDPNNCGTCGNVCPTAGVHTIPYCEDGECKTRCEGVYLNCDEAPGCETKADTNAFCYACDVECSPLLGLGSCCARTRSCATACL